MRRALTAPLVVPYDAFHNRPVSRSAALGEKKPGWPVRTAGRPPRWRGSWPRRYPLSHQELRRRHHRRMIARAAAGDQGRPLPPLCEQGTALHLDDVGRPRRQAGLVRAGGGHEGDLPPPAGPSDEGLPEPSGRGGELIRLVRRDIHTFHGEDRNRLVGRISRRFPNRSRRS